LKVLEKKKGGKIFFQGGKKKDGKQPLKQVEDETKGEGVKARLWLEDERGKLLEVVERRKRGPIRQLLRGQSRRFDQEGRKGDRKNRWFAGTWRQN